MKPTRKVTAGGLGGAIAVVLVWAFGLLGVEVPAEVAAAFATIAGTAASYMTEN